MAKARAVATDGHSWDPKRLEQRPFLAAVRSCGTHAFAADGNQQYGAANWVGAPGCTRLQLSARPKPTGDRLPAGALRVFSAVAVGDGAVVGIGTVLGEAPALLRREPDGSLRTLARLPMRWFDMQLGIGTRASGLVRMGQRLYLAGMDVVDGQLAPVVWASEDGGATLTQQRLPPAPGDHPPTAWGTYPVPARIATDGLTLLAAADGPDQDGRLWTWRSADAGRTWQVSASPPPVHYVLGISEVTDVIKVHGRWLVFGRTGSVPPGSAVLSSPDGARWTLEDSSGMGSGWVTGVTVDHRGALAVLGEFPGVGRGSGKGARTDRCGVVWSGHLGALRRQELGCTDARVNTSGPTAIATIADGRVLITNGADLWIRG